MPDCLEHPEAPAPAIVYTLSRECVAMASALGFRIDSNTRIIFGIPFTSLAREGDGCADAGDAGAYDYYDAVGFWICCALCLL